MKQDYGMFFCLFVRYARPLYIPDYALLQNVILLVLGQIQELGDKYAQYSILWAK